MKVLMHDGHVLTLPFTMTDTPAGSFERLDGNGAAAKGSVASMDDTALSALVRGAAAREDAIRSAADLIRDLRFIHTALIDLSDGAEVGIEHRRSAYRLLIPEQARAPRDPLAVGDRCAFNARARPKVLLNTHGVVESIQGERVTVRLDEGDRQRLIRATGKEHPVTAPAPVGILDKVPDGGQ
jgi:hypothetical protein